MTNSGSNLFQQDPMIYFYQAISKRNVEKTARTKLITVSEPQENLLSQLLSTFVSGHCTKLGIFFTKSQF